MNDSIVSWKKNFLKIYIGQAFSLLSSSAVQFAIIWWITIETGSALALTIASVVVYFPKPLSVYLQEYGLTGILVNMS